jgi:Holliday junction resolvase RusA-like endonuclease
LTDADGASAKAVIDGLVIAGIIIDDSPEYVKEVRYSQAKTTGEEKTIIEITE